MKKIRNSALALVLAMCVVTAARAQAPAAPVPVGRASVASIAAVNGLIADLGLPPQPLAQLIESRLPMPLEKGSVAEDQPLGVVILAGDKLPGDPTAALSNLVIVVPVVKGKLSEADLKKNAGAEAVKNQPGVMATTTASLRRTENYLLGQFGKPAGIGAVAADPFAADYKDKSNLAVVSLDVVTLRKVLGPTLKQMASQAQPQTVAPTATSPAMAYAGMATMAAGPAMNFLNSTDKLTVAVAQDDQNVHLRTWVSPFAVAGGTAATMQRPVFPKGTIFVTHIIYPGGPGSQWTDVFTSVVPITDPTFKAHEKEFREFGKRALRLFAGGDAVSIGVAPRGATATVYVVSQLHDAVDYASEVEELKKLSAVGQEPGESEEITTYDSGGKKVVRVTDKDASGKISMVIDGIQDGKTIFASFAKDDGQYVGDLAAGGMKESANIMMAGALDLGGLVDHLATAGPLAGMPTDAKKGLVASFSGQTVTWSAQVVPEQKSLLVQLHVHKAALKMLAQMRITQSQGMPPPQGMMQDQPAR